MKLNLSPVRLDEELNASVSGDVLTLNGVPFDFSPLLEGETLPADAIDSPWFSGPVTRVAGVIEVTLTLPHGADTPEATRFPAPVTAADGVVPLPMYNNPAPVTAPEPV